MSDSATKRMLRAYFQEGTPTMFFTGMFQVRQENIYNSESVEIDIERSDEDVAIAIQDMSAGGRVNTMDLYTNKQFTPPAFKEKISLNAFELNKTIPGDKPFKNPECPATLASRMLKGMRKVSKKIDRAIELMGSQVMQTGTATLIDSSGATIFVIDYKPKATHLPTAGTAWGTAGATPIADMAALADVVRDDYLSDPDQAIMGVDAFEAMIETDEVKSRLDTRRVDVGQIAAMQMRGNGGQFRGALDMGNYKLDIWTYNGKYKHQSTGVKTSFMDPSKVIIRASDARLDATYGAIPNLGSALGVSRQLVPGLPNRFTSAAQGVDLSVNTWLDANGENAHGQAGTRPLLIPTAIDSFGCLETNA